MFPAQYARFPLTALSLAILLGLPVAARAQVATSPDTATTLDAVNVKGNTAPTYTVEQTSAATRLSLSPQETPQSVSIITEQRIEDQNLTSVRDVLDNVTGVSSNAYDSERVLFYARGFAVENMAYDGVPVAPGLNSGSADASLDTSIYDRIEVVRGATGLMSGAGSPSATINFVRKHADSHTLQADASLSAGSYGNQRYTFDISAPLNKAGTVRGRLVAAYEKGDSYLDRYSSRKSVLYGVVDADLGPDTTLSVGFDYQKTTPKGVTWGSYPVYYDDGSLINWRRGFTSAAHWSFWNNTTKTVFADVKHQLNDDWQFRVMASHRETDANDALFYVYGFPNRDTGAGVEPYAYRGHDYGRQNMLDAYLNGKFQAFGRDHELVVGASGSRYTKDAYESPHGDLPAIDDFLSWNGNYPYPDFSATKALTTATRTEQSGLYVATRWSLADSLKLIAGARYSRWKNDTNDASAGIYHQDDRKTVPYAGLVYDITPVYAAFVSYTQIFDPQDNRHADGSFLEPMIGSSREVGIKGRHFDGLLNTSLTFFETRQDNVAEVAVGELLPDGLTQAYNSVNGTMSRGFEFEASGSLSDRWNGTLGWSHFNVKGPNGEGALRTALPRTLVRLFTTYHLPDPWQGLTIGGGANWQSASHAPVDGPNGPQRLDQSSVTLVSAMARYALTNRASIQLNADNLLNKKYFVLDEYSDLYYAPPSTVTLSFNYRFF